MKIDSWEIDQNRLIKDYERNTCKKDSLVI